jgi:IS30 family transposase
MRTYKQLTYEQRCQIEALNKSGITQHEIANTLEVSQSSISRELSQNTGLQVYRHLQAQCSAMIRRQATHNSYKMTDELIDTIERYLYQYWSPEQISGWLGLAEDLFISHEWTYQQIWKNKIADGDLHTCLRRRGSNGKTSSGQIKNRISIDKRPASVNEKNEAGHW